MLYYLVRFTGRDNSDASHRCHYGIKIKTKAGENGCCALLENMINLNFNSD